jgi:transposase
MGVLDRLMLSDGQRERMAARVVGDERRRGSSGRDNRVFVEAVLRVVRTGSPWRDLPDAFGAWNSAFRRFSRWSAKEGLASHLRGRERRPRLRTPHPRQRDGARPPMRCGRENGVGDQALGRSRGGLSTQLHLAVRGPGCPVRIILAAGHRGDAPQALAPLGEDRPEVVLAEAAYDADPFRGVVKARGGRAVEHPLTSRSTASAVSSSAASPS